MHLRGMSGAEGKPKSKISRVLIAGNHTCGNRGDAAILRGLLAHLNESLPDAAIEVTSRFPVSSEYLLGRPVIADVFDSWPTKFKTWLRGKQRQAYIHRIVPTLMGLAISRPILKKLLPAEITKRIDSLRDYDLIIQVGGSFFVDLYGYRQFETPFAALIARKPLLLIGHSMGPFGNRGYRRLAGILLRNASEVALREPVSLRMLKDAQLPDENITAGSDTAWLVAPTWPEERSPPSIPSERKVIAITLRNLAPFDVRLGVSQDAYETGFARLADALIELGYAVVAISTCTGIDGYQRDDRMPALRVRKLVRRPEHLHVVMDELNDVDLGNLLARCELLIGTRLHSAIIALNFGTPAIALNYEHKSAGVLQQLGLGELAAPVSGILDGTVLDQAKDVLAWNASRREAVLNAVSNERVRARTMIDTALEKVERALSA